MVDIEAGHFHEDDSLREGTEPQIEQLREVATLVSDIFDHPQAREHTFIDEDGFDTLQVYGTGGYLEAVGVDEAEIKRSDPGLDSQNSDAPGVRSSTSTTWFNMLNGTERLFEITEHSNCIVEVFRINESVQDPRVPIEIAQTQLGADASDERIAEYIDRLGNANSDLSRATGADTEFLQAYLRGVLAELTSDTSNRAVEKEVSPAEKEAIFLRASQLFRLKPYEVALEADAEVTAYDGTQLVVSEQNFNRQSSDTSIRSALMQAGLQSLKLRHTPLAHHAETVFPETLHITFEPLAPADQKTEFILERNEEDQLEAVRVEQTFDELSGEEDVPVRRPLTQQDALMLRSTFMQMLS